MDERVFENIPPFRESTETMLLEMIPAVIWYRSNRKGKEYWCNRCGAHGQVDKLSRTQTPHERKLLYSGHKEQAWCPECGVWAQMACLGRVKNYQRYSAYRLALVVSPISENEVWLREVLVSYEPGFWNDGKKDYETIQEAMPRIEEYVRYHLTPGKAEQYSFRVYGGWEKEPEIRDVVRANYPWHTEGYREGARTRMLVEGDLSDTFLRYNSFTQKKGYMGPVNIACYLANYAKYPSIEMMMKLGFAGIVYDLVANRKMNSKVVDWTQTDPRKAFGMSKELLPKLMHSTDQPHDLQEYHRHRRKGERDPWKCVELIREWRPSWGVKKWRETMRRCGATELELYRYFEKIREENPGCHMAHPPAVDSTWRDYIVAAEEVGYDLTQKAVVMPKDLYGKHDDAVALRMELKHKKEYEKNAAMREKFAERIPNLTKKYAKTSAQWFIRIPQTPEEIIAEGQALSHCVGGYNYIRNHAEGRNPILFLRRTADPDTPFYTMEIDVKSNKILQCEGCKSADGNGRYGHIHREDLPDDAKAFLDEWESARLKTETKNKETKTA